MKGYRDSWTFFTNHGHVYFLIARFPDLTVRQIADEVGVTVRSVLGILQDLENSGYIKKTKVGRNNLYSIVQGTRLRHPLEHNVKLKELLRLVQET